jgi:transcription initiation protein SPT3
MTKEEYIEFAECRQASFTYKKSKKFRDWLGPFGGSPSSAAALAKPSDDVLEILGFLLWEGLRRLTLTALKVQRLQASTETSMDTATSPYLAKLRANSVFAKPSQRQPLQPAHIYEAYSYLQQRPKSILRRYSSPSAKRQIVLI